MRYPHSIAMHGIDIDTGTISPAVIVSALVVPSVSEKVADTDGTRIHTRWIINMSASNAATIETLIDTYGRLFFTNSMFNVFGRTFDGETPGPDVEELNIYPTHIRLLVEIHGRIYLMATPAQQNLGFRLAGFLNGRPVMAEMPADYVAIFPNDFETLTLLFFRYYRNGVIRPRG